MGCEFRGDSEERGGGWNKLPTVKYDRTSSLYWSHTDLYRDHSSFTIRRCSSASAYALDLTASLLLLVLKMPVLFFWHCQHKSVIGFITTTEGSNDRQSRQKRCRPHFLWQIPGAQQHSDIFSKYSIYSYLKVGA